MSAQPSRPNPGYVEPGGSPISGPTVLFALGLVAFALGLWILAPWVAFVVIGAGAMASAVVAALPRREA